MALPDFARSFTFHPGRVAAIEAGEVRPTPAELYVIAVALDATMGDLFRDMTTA